MSGHFPNSPCNVRFTRCRSKNLPRCYLRENGCHESDVDHTSLALLDLRRARACLREQIHERAIQWSSQIVEAKLVEVSERIEMKAVIIKPKPGTKGSEASAVYYYCVYSFEVEKVIESAGNSLKPKYRFEVLRFFGKIDDANAAAVPAAAHPCADTLSRAALGHSFVLLLKHEQDVKMDKPPVWNHPKNLDPRDAEVHGTRAYVAIHLMLREKTTDAEMAKLRAVLTETRAAEKKVSDAEMRKSIDAIVHAASDAQAESATVALRAVGFKAVGHLKSARDRKGISPVVKERLAKLAIELSPTPIPILVGEHGE